MFTVKTATKTYKAKWIAISFIDGILRMSLTGIDLSEAMSVFTNPNETSVIERLIEDTVDERYEGYTTFVSVNVNIDGSIDIGLRK